MRFGQVPALEAVVGCQVQGALMWGYPMASTAFRCKAIASTSFISNTYILTCSYLKNKSNIEGNISSRQGSSLNEILHPSPHVLLTPPTSPMDTSSQSQRNIELIDWTGTNSNERNNSNSVSDQYGGAQDVEGRDIVIQQLKPVDGGPDAWKVLIAAFVFEALLWGISS